VGLRLQFETPPGQDQEAIQVLLDPASAYSLGELLRENADTVLGRPS